MVDTEFSLIEAIVNKPNPVIFDVGGYKGIYAQNFLSAFPGADIYIFESIPRYIENIKARGSSLMRPMTP